MTSSNKLAPLVKHATHKVKIVLLSGSKHYAKYHCVDCDKWVAWLGRNETNRALELGLVDEHAD